MSERWIFKPSLWGAVPHLDHHFKKSTGPLSKTPVNVLKLCVLPSPLAIICGLGSLPEETGGRLRPVNESIAVLNVKQIPGFERPHGPFLLCSVPVRWRPAVLK